MVFGQWTFANFHFPSLTSVYESWLTSRWHVLCQRFLAPCILDPGWEWQHPWGPHYHEAHHRAEGTHCGIKRLALICSSRIRGPAYSLGIGRVHGVMGIWLEMIDSQSTKHYFEWYSSMVLKKVPVPHSLSETKMRLTIKIGLTWTCKGWRNADVLMHLKAFTPGPHWCRKFGERDGNLGHPIGFWTISKDLMIPGWSRTASWRWMWWKSWVTLNSRCKINAEDMGRFSAFFYVALWFNMYRHTSWT